MNYKKIKEIKGISREALTGCFGTCIGAMMLLRLILMVASSVASNATAISGMVGQIMYGLIAFIIELLIAVLYIGEKNIYVKILKGEKAGIGDLFGFIQDHPDRPILAQFPFAILEMIAMITSSLAMELMIAGGSDQAYMLLTIISVITLILYVIISVLFSQVFYILIDEPDIQVPEAFKKSIAMTKGHRMRWIGIQLQFIPLYLLSILSLCIGHLFITPYKKMTLTAFYNDLKDNYNKSSQE